MYNRNKIVQLMLCGIVLISTARAQDPKAMALISQVKSKLDQVNNYMATGIMKTNVSFLKVPQAAVKVYFKAPDKLKIQNDQGISLVPKGLPGMTLTSVLKGNYSMIDGGSATIDGVAVHIIKLLPADENADIVLTTMYIDEKRAVVVRARTTTRENGSYEVTLAYGKYVAYALPDKVIFTFNTKEYKLPKGITFDYDDGSNKKKQPAANDTKGQVEIDYSSYTINKGIPDNDFAK